eukprot:31270-Pelagococcus_subviridis.AAC.31
MLRPRPVPQCDRVVASSACSKGLKIVSSLSAGIPGPVSDTVNRTSRREGNCPYEVTSGCALDATATAFFFSFALSSWSSSATKTWSCSVTVIFTCPRSVNFTALETRLSNTVFTPSGSPT